MRTLICKKDNLSQSISKPFFSPVIQTKSNTGSSGDIYEYEADKVADHIAKPLNTNSFFNPQPFIQKHTEDSSTPSLKPFDSINSGKDVHRQIQTKSVMPCGTEGASITPVVQEVLHSPGRSLDPSVRSYMEPRFGHDFSQIHIHTSSQADQANKQLQSRAFTCGQNIAFRQGEYDPVNNKGKMLLAHELTHTLQQNKSTGDNRIQKQNEDPAKNVSISKRTAVVNLAQQLLNQHYLYGAAGEIPDKGAGLSARKVTLDKTTNVASITFYRSK